MKEYQSMDESVLMRYFTGDMLPAEKAEVEQWIKASDVNRQTAEGIRYILTSIDVVNTMKGINSHEALRTVKKRIHPVKKMSYIAWMQRIAAILFIPLLISSLYYLTKESPVRYMETRINPGMIGSIELADGSKVWLNSGSYLKYPVTFDHKVREVYLEGEAYFTVQSDNQKKFVVNTSDEVSIEVLGTEFNVDSYEDNNFIATTLVTGSIRLLYHKNGKEESLVMKPNQKIIYEKGEQRISSAQNIYTPKDIAWKEGRIVLRATPLTEVMWILSKRFNVEFVLNKESLRDNSFTGTFSDQNLERILEHLKISSNIRYRFEKTETTQTGEASRFKVVLD